MTIERNHIGGFVITAFLALACGLLFLPSRVTRAGDAPVAMSSPKWLGLDEFRGGVSLRWFRVQGAVRYGVWRRVGEQGEFKQVGFAENPVYEDLQVVPGNSYFYRVIPYDGQGKAGLASEDRYIFLAKEEAGTVTPPEWSATRVNADGLALSWSHPSPGGILAYNLYRREKKEEALQLVTSTVDTTFLDRAVKAGRTYSYVVTALSRTLQESDYSRILEVLNVPPSRAALQRSPFTAVRTLDQVIVHTEQVASHGPEKFGFVSPVDVDYLPSAQRLFVADAATNLITVIDSRGEVAGTMGGVGSDPGRFERLMGIAVDRQGTLYAVDAYRGEVLYFDPQMQFAGRIGLRDKVEKYFGKDFYERYPAFRFGLVDLAIGPSGSLLISDNPSGWIYVLDGNQNLVRVISGKGENPGSLHYPTFIAVDWEGRILVSDSLNSRVQMFDLSGNPLAVIGDRGLGIGQFIRPKGLVLDRMGNVYIADSYLNAVQVFSGDGDYIGLLADKDGLPLDLGLPNGIAFIDPDLLVLTGKVSRTVKVIRIPVLELKETVSLNMPKASSAPAQPVPAPVEAAPKALGRPPVGPPAPAGAQ